MAAQVTRVVHADGRRRGVPFVDRFNASWTPGAGGCHLWQRAANSRGYGAIWFEGKVQLAHRVAWHLAHGRWPADGLVLDHVCETKLCVNAAHLREVTNRFNVLRSPLSPMNTVAASPTCRNGHLYPLDVERDANGWRVCLVCAGQRGGWTS